MEYCDNEKHWSIPFGEPIKYDCTGWLKLAPTHCKRSLSTSCPSHSVQSTDGPNQPYKWHFVSISTQEAAWNKFLSIYQSHAEWLNWLLCQLPSPSSPPYTSLDSICSWPYYIPKQLATGRATDGRTPEPTNQQASRQIAINYESDGQQRTRQLHIEHSLLGYIHCTTNYLINWPDKILSNPTYLLESTT